MTGTQHEAIPKVVQGDLMNSGDVKSNVTDISSLTNAEMPVVQFILSSTLYLQNLHLWVLFPRVENNQ